MDFQKNVVFDSKYILIDVPTGLMTGAESIQDVAYILWFNNLDELDVIVPSELLEIRIRKNSENKYVSQSAGINSVGTSICILANNAMV